MNFSLTGKNNINTNNLSGKNTINNHKTNKLKIRILNIFILPLLSKQFNKIKENIFLLEPLKHLIDKEYLRNKDESILIYKDILNMFQIFMDHMVENAGQLNSLSSERNQIINMVYRTTMIRIMPEYEIYDNIIGKPKREENQFYKEDIIKDIQRYMLLENTTFKIICDQITNKYLIYSKQ